MDAVGQVAQVGRDEQVTEAVRLLDDTRRRLHLLLAGEPTEQRPSGEDGAAGTAG